MRGMRKTALITGATTGIGQAFARALAARKFDLVITGRQKERLKSLAAELSEREGVTVDVVIVELGDPKMLDKFCRSLPDRCIHTLVNNAGFGFYKTFQDSSPEELVRMIDVHDSAVIRITRAVLPGMIERNSGTIINVASQAARTILPKSAVYSASKAFIASFSEGLYLDIYNTDIVVQALCPGLTHTSFHEKFGMTKDEQVTKGLIRWMEPEEIVKISFEHADKNTGRKRKTVLCIPGAYTRWTVRLAGLVPRSLYYGLVASIVNKYR